MPINRALKLAPNRDVRTVAAMALARAGDTAGAEKLASELDKTYPMDTIVQRYWLPTIRAAVALERNDPSRNRANPGVVHQCLFSLRAPKLTIRSY